MFIAGKNKIGYFIKYEEEYYSPQSDDQAICEIINIDYNVYRKTIIENYEAFLDDCDDLYFKKEEDALMAIEWIKSIEIMNKLSQKSNDFDF